jgi:glucans biosynthesis protein
MSPPSLRSACPRIKTGVLDASPIVFRVHLFFGILTVFLLFATWKNHRKFRFTFHHVVEQAQALAGRSYVPPDDKLPDFLQKLDYDQTRDIRWRNSYSLWEEEARVPFRIRFFHRTGRQPDRVEMDVIRQGRVERIHYSPRQFDFGKNIFPSPVPSGLGFAGFRVHFPINRKDVFDEVIVFLGGTYFRAVGKDQQYGLSARGLAVNTGLKETKEEFPRFTHFWIEEPGENALSLEIYALMESASATGAYRFVVTPGEATHVDVHAVAFFRKKVRRLGLAPLTSMYWFGENHRLDIRDFRPEVHDSDGLLMHPKKEEWIWRPLSNARFMRENLFQDHEPKGFGLLQRDRNFDNYQDLEARYHERPSVWIEPADKWGLGDVHLLQFPTNNETHDNVVCFWAPRLLPEKGGRLEWKYRMRWLGSESMPPSLATCTQTRIHYPVKDEPALFVLDFSGNGLEKIPADQPPRIDISSVPPARFDKVAMVKNDYNRGWRLQFAVPSAPGPVELRSRLMGEAGPLSETWTYTWEPTP